MGVSSNINGLDNSSMLLPLVSDTCETWRCNLNLLVIYSRLNCSGGSIERACVINSLSLPEMNELGVKQTVKIHFDL